MMLRSTYIDQKIQNYLGGGGEIEIHGICLILEQYIGQDAKNY